MAASRTPADTVPEELQRQSERIQEQYERLTSIINTIRTDLSDMSTIMGPYSADVVAQINNLNEALGKYKDRSADIYTDVSNSLAMYAANLLQNLESLRTSIENIGTTIEGL